jgi:hypothetical protein
MHRVSRKSVLVIVLSTTFWISQVRAEFIKIDDFESYTLGPLDGQSDGSGTWDAASIQQVIVEPNTNNQVLDTMANAAETNSFLDDPNLEIADGTIGTLFFRMK